ncbi:hypothetical protein Y032_0014g2285 [Ancylostoma ceylanicum]|uniref:Uncharacterized protein n=1 Tax=Ancylostoma ceylanicum TaxID=53326 RepID=A0A016VAN7_9BILA|nr:hypothetical protein Y032_0014g2285 [Ancylostoma ceylanicum]
MSGIIFITEIIRGNRDYLPKFTLFMHQKVYPLSMSKESSNLQFLTVRQSTNLPQTSGSTTSNGQFDSCYLRDFVRTALFYLFFIKGNFCETTQRPKIASFRDMGSIAESVKQDNPEYPGNAWRGRVNKWTGQRLFEKFG